MNKKEIAFSFLKELAFIESELISYNERKSKQLITKETWSMCVSRLQAAEHAIKKVAYDILGKNYYKIFDKDYIYTRQLRALAQNDKFKIRNLSIFVYEEVFGELTKKTA